ncbi:hypothetical protein [Streptomyces spinosirectus]
MESAVDLSFYRRGRLLQTVTVLQDSEDPGVGDITWDQLVQWLGDIGKALFDGLGGKWSSVVDDATKFLHDLTAGSNVRRAINGQLVLWQGGLMSPQVAWADELRIVYRAWSDDNLSGTPDARIVVSPDTAVPVIDQGSTRDTHHYTHRFSMRLDTRGPGGFLLLAGAGDSGWQFNVSIATTLLVTLTPAIKQARHSGGLAQSNFGATGNFELLAAAGDRGLVSYWRDNDDALLPWHGPYAFGDDLGPVDGVSVVQSTWGTPGLGRLAAAVQHQGLLSVLWRDDQPPFDWSAPQQLASGTRGSPALIQGSHGEGHGNFELIVPDGQAGLRHYWSAEGNPDAPFQWLGPVSVALSLGPVDAVALCQSTQGTPGLGNLELLARAGQSVYFLERRGDTLTWSAPVEIAHRATGSPSIIQSRFGTYGNFEAVVPCVDGGFWSMWRNNDLIDRPWSSPQQQAPSLGVLEHTSLIQSTFNEASIGNLELIVQAGEQISLLWRPDRDPFTWQPPQPLHPTGTYAANRIAESALRSALLRRTDPGTHLIARRPSPE